MKSKQFYKMLSEIHNEVADQSDGCMGCDYTPERVEKEDVEKLIRMEPSHTLATDGDYLGNIIRKYVEIDEYDED